jgi:RNA polymerase sigma factor (sigma-70 family)
MTDSQKLLAEFARTGSEAAFRELLTRYVDLVHSAAIRLVNGDAHTAQDIAQTVFVDLARKARSLPPEVMLGGWLHRHTCFVAANLMRGDRRRQARERQAADMNAVQQRGDSNLADVAPILDDAINQLGSEDRTAILLRFFEQLDFRTVGEALGSTEEAAKKRVSRALDKLQQLLTTRGVSLSATALGGALAAEAIKAAPAGLVASIAGTALANSAAAGGTTATFFKVMTTFKLTFGVAGAVAVAGVAVLIKQHAVEMRLRDENGLLRQQIERLTAEAQGLSSQVAQANNGQTQSADQERELLRLRGEVGALRRQLASTAKSNDKNAQRLPAAADDAQEQQRQAAIAKMQNVKLWLLAFHRYAADHQGQFPSGFDQVSNQLDQVMNRDLQPGQVPPNTEEFAQSTNTYEIVYQGLLNDITSPSSIIVMREKDSWPAPNGGWCRTYGFADGHTEIHKAEDGNFAPWEARHFQGSNAQ